MIRAFKSRAENLWCGSKCNIRSRSARTIASGDDLDEELRNLKNAARKRVTETSNGYQIFIFSLSFAKLSNRVLFWSTFCFFWCLFQSVWSFANSVFLYCFIDSELQTFLFDVIFNNMNLKICICFFNFYIYLCCEIFFAVVRNLKIWTNWNSMIIRVSTLPTLFVPVNFKNCRQTSWVFRTTKCWYKKHLVLQSKKLQNCTKFSNVFNYILYK